jgi:hypothetical protein
MRSRYLQVADSRPSFQIHSVLILANCIACCLETLVPILGGHSNEEPREEVQEKSPAVGYRVIVGASQCAPTWSRRGVQRGEAPLRLLFFPQDWGIKGG